MIGARAWLRALTISSWSSLGYGFDTVTSFRPSPSGLEPLVGTYSCSRPHDEAVSAQRVSNPRVRTVVVVSQVEPSGGRSAKLLHPEEGFRPVPLAPVRTWRDLADHAATYCARIVVSPQVRAEMMRAGRWNSGPPFDSIATRSKR